MALSTDDKNDIVNAISEGFKGVKFPQGNQPSSGQSSSGGNVAGEYISAFTDKVNKAGKATATMGDFMYRAGGSVSQFAKTVENTLPSFAGLTGVLAGGAGSVAQYLETTQAAFQGLSKTGLQFNGDLGLIRQTAARARMPLEEFATLVGKNSANLIALGAGADKGAKMFADLSQAMFEDGPIDGMMALGYSLKDTNEFLMDFTTLNRRDAAFQRMNAPKQAQAAAEFAKNLSIVSKLTGQQAKDLKNELMERQNAGATQAKLRLLEKQGVEGVQQSYNAAQTELEKGPEVLQNLMDDLLQTGVPMSDATAAFAATNKEAYALAKQAAAAVKAGDMDKAKALSEKAAAASLEYANSEQGLRLATLAQVSEIGKAQAQNLEQVGPLIDAINVHAKSMSQSMGRTVGTVEAFESLTAKMTEEQKKVVALQGPNQQALNATNEAQQQLANLASKMNENLAKQIQGGSKLGDKFAGMADSLENDTKKLVDAIASTLAIGTEAMKDTDGKTTEQNRNDPNVNNAQPGPSEDEAKGIFRRFIVDPIIGLFDGKATGGTISPSGTYMVGEKGPEIISGQAGTVVNAEQTANAIDSGNKNASQDMAKLVDAMTTANDQLSTLIAINTRQTVLSDRQVKAIKGAGNLIKGV
tara:strand:+ start:2233 stop:4158 length:1926 start_codon:yes stop_codon:yes gene_type:complete